jgi:hypothetical protein
MAGKRFSPINPFLAALCKERGYITPQGEPNLKAAALGLNIPYSTLVSYGKILDGTHQNLQALMVAAEGFGLSETELVRGLLFAASHQESA